MYKHSSLLYFLIENLLGIETSFKQFTDNLNFRIIGYRVRQK